MRIRILIAMFLTLGTLGALAAQDAPVKPVDVAGVWEMTTQGTPQGDMTGEATFVQEGDKIKFTMTGDGGFEMTGEGTVKGNELEWTVVISGGMGEFTLTYKAKVEGETMTGEVQAGDFGSFPITAKKKK
jgi:hypothetical protein